MTSPLPTGRVQVAASSSASPASAASADPVSAVPASLTFPVSLTVRVVLVVLAVVATGAVASASPRPRRLAAVAPAAPARPGRGADPARSRPPGPGFVRYCLRHGSRYLGTIVQCNDAARYDVDGARHAEGLRNLALAPGLSSRATDTQLVLVTDAERTSRDRPRLGETAALDERAISAAEALTDPMGPSGRRWVSNWAGGYRTPLAADYAWMYDDGVGGTNLACTAPSSPGCWEHRHNILAPFRGSMGAGQVEVHGVWSAAEVLVRS